MLKYLKVSKPHEWSINMQVSIPPFDTDIPTRNGRCVALSPCQCNADRLHCIFCLNNILYLNKSDMFYYSCFLLNDVPLLQICFSIKCDYYIKIIAKSYQNGCFDCGFLDSVWSFHRNETISRYIGLSDRDYLSSIKYAEIHSQTGTVVKQLMQ